MAWDLLPSATQKEDIKMPWKKIRRLLYRLLPSCSTSWHEKRRKGYQAQWGGGEVIECQAEQDRIFWEKVLDKKTGGTFWELDAGDGSTGSHGVFLEDRAGWRGVLWEPRARPARRAGEIRRSPVLDSSATFPESLVAKNPSPDLVILRNSERLPGLQKVLQELKIHPKWLVIQCPRPSVAVPQAMKRAGYRLIWAFHDDEYYQRRLA
jgi:hypothetical protein